MSIQTFSLKFTVQTKGEGTLFFTFLKPTKITKKREASLGKNRHNYEKITDETCVYEQKLIKTEEFN